MLGQRRSCSWMMYETEDNKQNRILKLHEYYETFNTDCQRLEISLNLQILQTTRCFLIDYIYIIETI